MKTITIVLTTIMLFAISLTNCKKVPEIPIGNNKIEIGETTAKSISYFTSDVSTSIITISGNEIIQIGHCWGLNHEPTIENSESTSGILDSLTLISELTGLGDNMAYFVRPFITSKHQTIYGQEIIIETLSTGKPVVTTNEVTNITYNTAICGGFNDAGGLTVSQRGICWNTTGNPTLENNTGLTNIGSGTGSFTSQMTGLSKNTTYYVAAWATNEKGTSYGQVNSFIATNDFTDPRDGQSYGLVVIGSQKWMAENINYQSESSWWYNNNSESGEIYGRLYTWEAATTACPDGWHLPTDDEWKTLEIFLGMSQSQADASGYRGTDEGKKLKNISGWSNNTGTDAVGFSALPGGYRDTDGYFRGLSTSGYWWSATTDGSSTAWYRMLNYNYEEVSRGTNNMEYGNSVRCIKD